MASNERSLTKVGCTNAFSFEKLPWSSIRIGLPCDFHLRQHAGCWPNNRTQTVYKNSKWDDAMGHPCHQILHTFTQ